MSATSSFVSRIQKTFLIQKNISVAGLLSWVVLQIHLSSLNNPPALDHLVTVHDTMDFSSFSCAPCAAPSSFSLTHRLREHRQTFDSNVPANTGEEGNIEVEHGKSKGSVA